MTEKARESRLRRRLQGYGYLLRKSRGTVCADNLGEYMIVDASTNGIVRGARFDYTLDDVEEFLNG